MNSNGISYYTILFCLKAADIDYERSFEFKNNHNVLEYEVNIIRKISKFIGVTSFKHVLYVFSMLDKLSKIRKLWFLHYFFDKNCLKIIKKD